ncbi:MAG TPA: hypothetical protein VF278_12645 [Pirellulales bacterium]
MPNPLTVRRLLALALCLLMGCAVSPGAKKSSAALATDPTSATSNSPTNSGLASPPTAVNGSNSAAAPAAGPSAANANPAGAAKSASSSAPDPRVLDDVLAQIGELGPIEPEARKRLIDDLRQTDPSYWPMLVQTFRASLEYRRRSQQKAAEPAANDGPENGATEVLAPPGAEPRPGSEIVQLGQAPRAAANHIIPVAANMPASSASAAPAGLPAAGGKPPAPPVVQAGSAKGEAASDWRRHLDAAIAELERQTREHTGEDDAWTKQVYLRLLDLAAGRRDDALKPISGLPPAQQDYWARQIFALSASLDQGTTDAGRRAAEAGLHLSRAVAALGEQAPLVVHNLAFCTDVHSYGVLKRFEPAEFHAGQQLLLYAEIENFKSEESAQGFHTSLEASYQINDRQGRRVAHDELSLTEEHCQNRRRDFFVRYFITLPKNIYEGDYTLDLTVEDKLGHKINQGSIDFSVKTK